MRAKEIAAKGDIPTRLGQPSSTRFRASEAGMEEEQCEEQEEESEGDSDIMELTKTSVHGDTERKHRLIIAEVIDRQLWSPPKLPTKIRKPTDETMDEALKRRRLNCARAALNAWNGAPLWHAAGALTLAAWLPKVRAETLFLDEGDDVIVHLLAQYAAAAEQGASAETLDHLYRCGTKSSSE
jgi:hypothetical protein